jgi:hypothetical protein
MRSRTAENAPSMPITSSWCALRSPSGVDSSSEPSSPAAMTRCPNSMVTPGAASAAESSTLLSALRLTELIALEPSALYDWNARLPSRSWSIRPRIGMAWAITASSSRTRRRASMPRADRARLIDRPSLVAAARGSARRS